MCTCKLNYLFMLLFTLVTETMFAHDIAVVNQENDTIFYNIINDGNELAVTYKEGNGFNNISKDRYKGSITIPETIFYNNQTYKVVKIGESAFFYCDELTNVILPPSIIEIGNSAFKYCSALTNLTIPKSVTSIGKAVFSSCNSLKNIYLPNSISSIGSSTFRNCTEIEEISLPTSLSIISEQLFNGCTKLKSISIPDSVTSIEMLAFANCSSLNSVTIGKSVSSIAQRAFEFCASLNAVHIKDIMSWCKIKFGEPGILSGANPLIAAKHLYLNDKEIEDLVIPDGITQIEDYTFSRCLSITNVSFPNSLKTIGFNAFSDCINLKKVIIPNSVTNINGESFKNCDSLTSISIGKSVKTIGGGAFSNCNALRTVKSYIIEPFPITNFPYNVYRNGTLYVPANTKELYCRLDGWRDFLKIQEMDDSDEPYNPEWDKCMTPTISYNNGEIMFHCETEDVEFVSEIKDDDIKKYFDNKITLTATYNISVFAKKEGYNNSDVVNAKLCWLESTPETEGVTNLISKISAQPVLIQSFGNIINIQGLDENTLVIIYDSNGQMVGKSTVNLNSNNIKTSLKKGDIAIVKFGNHCIKLLMK